MKAKARRAVNKGWAYAKLIGIRAFGAMILGAIGIFIGYQIDYTLTERAPATDYVKYSQFTVQNARVGEDVNFKLCREYEETYLVRSTIDVYVVQNPGTQAERVVAVYGRDYANTLAGTCVNATIRNVDFQHLPGEYEIKRCSNFEVRYSIAKSLCVTSNRYRVYDMPRTLESQIKDLERQRRELEERLKESRAAGNQPQIETQQSSQPPVTSPPEPEERRQAEQSPPAPTPEPVPENGPNTPENVVPGREPASNIVDGTRDLTCDLTGAITLGKLPLLCR